MNAVLEDEGVRRAGIEPDLDQIVDLVVIVGVVLVAEETRLRALGEPGVGALVLEGLGDARVDVLVVKDLVLALAHENRKRHAPGALARQHPVGLVGDHALDAVLAGLGHPTGLFDRVDREFAQGLSARRVGEGPVHRKEPLRRVAEDHRLLRSPAMRILVLELSARDERAGLDQRLDDGVVGVALLALLGQDAPAREARRLVGQHAVLVHRVGNARLDPALLKSRVLAVQSSKSSRPWLGAV